MIKSYPTRGTSVNTAAAKPRLEQAGASSRTSAGISAAPAPSARDTATFEPYFWEAYNQIARPDRFDWYLITRWLPELGPEGFAVLKALRTLCYFNPKEGTLRDTCQITVDELAEMTGMKRSSLYRVLENNEALAQFVQKQPETIHVEGRTRRLPPRWRVSMDTPIHPRDREEYDLLRAGKEIDRASAEEEKRKSQIEIYEKRKSQIEICGGRKSQNDERKSQNDERKSQSGILLRKSLLSEGSTKEDFTSPGGASASDSMDAPPINSPQGEHSHSSAVGREEPLAEQVGREEDSDSPAPAFDPVPSSWHVALSHLSTLVNTPTLNAHLKPMRLVSVTDTEAEHGKAVAEAVLLAPSAFSRNWIEGRHRADVEGALAEALGRPVTVQFTTGGK